MSSIQAYIHSTTPLNRRLRTQLQNFGLAAKCRAERQRKERFCISVSTAAGLLSRHHFGAHTVLRQEIQGSNLALPLERALREQDLAKYLAEVRQAQQADSSAGDSVSWRHDVDVEKQHVRFLNLAVDQGQLDAALTLLQILPLSVDLWGSLLKAAGTGGLEQLDRVLKVDPSRAVNPKLSVETRPQT